MASGGDRTGIFIRRLFFTPPRRLEFLWLRRLVFSPWPIMANDFGGDLPLFDVIWLALTIGLFGIGMAYLGALGRV